MAQYVNLQKINSISPCFFCMMSKKRMLQAKNLSETPNQTVKFYFFENFHFASGFSGWRSVFAGRKVAKS